MRIILFPTFFLLCALLALSGCGKKGALYLPDNTASAASAQPTQPPQK